MGSIGLIVPPLSGSTRFSDFITVGVVSVGIDRTVRVNDRGELALRIVFVDRGRTRAYLWSERGCRIRTLGRQPRIGRHPQDLVLHRRARIPDRACSQLLRRPEQIGAYTQDQATHQSNYNNHWVASCAHSICIAKRRRVNELIHSLALVEAESRAALHMQDMSCTWLAPRLAQKK